MKPDSFSSNMSKLVGKRVGKLEVIGYSAKHHVHQDHLNDLLTQIA